MQEKKICPNCNNEVAENDTFCPNCGKGLNEQKSISADSFIIAQYGTITLTRDYVHQSTSKLGRKYSAHIFLKDISCIEVGFKSYPKLLIFGIPLILLWGLGLLLVIAYFITRKHAIVITSSGNVQIEEVVPVGSSTTANNFVGSVVLAKKNELDSLTIR